MGLNNPAGEEKIMSSLMDRAAEYAPEWKMGQGDAGYALCRLFAEMFLGTAERMAEVAHKNYDVFLSLIGADRGNALPSTGYARFEASPAAPGAAAINAGTALLAKNADGNNVAFETLRTIEATPAALTGVFYADGDSGVIQRRPIARPGVFFAPDGSPNLQKHVFALTDNSVLTVSGECDIDVELNMRSRFEEREAAQTLADARLAAWMYFDGTQYREFESVSALDGVIRLHKAGGGPIMSDADGNRYVYCRIKGGVPGNITLLGARLKSSVKAPVPADELYYESVPLDGPGYCFGERPSEYDVFYIRQDDVFSKRGANVSVEFDISRVVHSDVEPGKRYIFDRYLIDKRDAEEIKLEDVYIERVAFEYFNGIGWAALKTGGDKNPFDCAFEGKRGITFICPDDIEPSQVNAVEGVYIRARVTSVKSFASPAIRWLIPYLKEARCGYSYSGGREAIIYSINGGEERRAARGVTVYEAMEPGRFMYFKFDRPPAAFPLSVYFETEGGCPLKLRFEAFMGGKFSPLRVVDGTNGLSHRGTALIFMDKEPGESVFLGEEGFYIRVSSSGGAFPYVSKICLNAVEVAQRRKADDEYFNVDYRGGRKITLSKRPVLKCEVYSDETGKISPDEAEELEKKGGALLERGNGEIERCWVKWRRMDPARDAQGERLYELNAYAGEITLCEGGGIAENTAMRVAYSFGGGEEGNLPAGALSNLMDSLPYIDGVEGITDMAGGAGRRSLEKAERLGSSRIRHMDRAISAFDYENMALSRFERLSRAKCFPNTNAMGQSASGHVLLVIAGDGGRGLCDEVYGYLAPRADLNLISSGRLSVISAPILAASVTLRADIIDYALAFATAQEAARRISGFIENDWAKREIGARINPAGLISAVKAVQNIAAVRSISIEGSYIENGLKRVISLDEGITPRFCVIVNGEHTVAWN